MQLERLFIRRFWQIPKKSILFVGEVNAVDDEKLYSRPFFWSL